MYRWENKVAVVTGSGSGIGASIAKELVNAGLKVVGLDVLESQESYAETLNSTNKNFFPLVVDVSNEDEVLNAFSWIEGQLGPVHVLINNAAVQKPTSLIDGNTDMWKETLNTNVLGLCILTREAVKSMKENDVNGHIIHLNSIGGHQVPPLVQGNVYSASKHAVTALTETLRLELNAIGSKIKVTSISPSCVNTKMFHNACKVNYELFHNKPVLHSDDVAECVLYVLSTPPTVQIHELMINAI